MMEEKTTEMQQTPMEVPEIAVEPSSSTVPANDEPPAMNEQSMDSEVQLLATE